VHALHDNVLDVIWAHQMCVSVAQVRVHNFAEYRSLPLEIVEQVVPSDGRTHKAKKLLKKILGHGHVAKLCRTFAKQHRSC